MIFKGITKLYLARDNLGMHRIFPSNLKTSGFVEVKTERLEDYFMDKKFFKCISFIKIDVEGSELQVVKGLDGLLKIDNLKVLLEFVPPYIEECGDDPIELLRIFERNKFDIFYVNNKIQQIQKANDATEVSKKFFEYKLPEGWSDVTNLIFMKK